MAGDFWVYKSSSVLAAVVAVAVAVVVGNVVCLEW